MFRTSPRLAEADGRRSAPLRQNFAATFTGNAVFAASQWAVLSLVAKLGGAQMLGEYALAVAVASPLALFSHLNLRAVLATDAARLHSFGDYMAVRLATTAAALLAVLAVALAAGYGLRLGSLIVGIGLVLSLDNVSDICYGALQRRERLDQVAWSTAARGLLSLSALAATLWLTGSLVAAVAAQALARAAVLAVYDWPTAASGESTTRSGAAVQAAVARTALPLGLVMLLVSLSANLPRYAIERNLGTVELGVFAAVASFQTVGSTVVNALGQAAMPRLARYFSAGDWGPFRKLALQLSALATLLGLAGVAAAWVLGRPLLGLVYRSGYAAYSNLLIAAMAAAILIYLGGALGYVITSARAFVSQTPLFACVAATSGAASWLLVPHLGLYGAVLALAIAWTVQIAGELLILRAALHPRGKP